MMGSPTRSARNLAASATETANQAVEVTKDNQFLLTQVLDEMSKLTEALDIIWAQQEALRGAMEAMDTTLAALKQTVLRSGNAVYAQFDEAERSFAEKKAKLRAAREASLEQAELANTPAPVENKPSPVSPGSSSYPAEAFVFGG
jgi:peptidoglycan hydrolase CwlO-like protein